jgi:hypothetical protein
LSLVIVGSASGAGSAEVAAGSEVGDGSVVGVSVGLGSAEGVSVGVGSGAGMSDGVGSADGDVVSVVVVSPLDVSANAYDDPIASDIVTVKATRSDANRNPRETR